MQWIKKHQDHPRGKAWPAYPSEVMVCIFVLKHLNNLSDEAMESLLLERARYKRFCQLGTSRIQLLG